jgi:hypothetical protein
MRWQYEPTLSKFHAHWVYRDAEDRAHIGLFEDGTAAYCSRTTNLRVDPGKLPDLPTEELKHYLVTLWRMS